MFNSVFASAGEPAGVKWEKFTQTPYGEPMTADPAEFSKFRPGKKVRGQPANIYGEKKQNIKLSLTPTAINRLKGLADKINSSASETMEILLRQPNGAENILLEFFEDSLPDYPLSVKDLEIEHRCAASTIYSALQASGRFSPPGSTAEYEGIKLGDGRGFRWHLRKIR